MVQFLTSENEGLKAKIERHKQDYEVLIITNKGLVQNVEQRDTNLHNVNMITTNCIRDAPPLQLRD